MDFLAVAAAAGAGYVAKCLHKISKENDGESSSNPTKAARVWQEWAKTRPLTDTSDDFCSERLGELGRFEDCNLPSLTGYPLGVSENETFRFGGENLGWEALGKEVEFPHRFPKGGLIRSRRPYTNFTKPLISLESCLAAQLYKQHCEMENYVLTPLPHPSTRTRPLLVTDGKRVISRASSEFQADMKLEMNQIEDRTLFRAPLLPKRPMKMKRRSVDFQRRLKQNDGGQRVRKTASSSATMDVQTHNPKGSPSGMLLFLVGVTLGILSTALANRREVDKLTELLKQSKNLVQDLQEEIEMKDSVTVKELASEKIDIHESDGKQSEMMSQIEAELEAELERLELNMKGSTLERIADFVELDPGYEADIAKGEFRFDTITKQVNEGGSESDEDSQDGTSTGHSDNANRPVSPRELSLRLHEVIEARLEARIMELEAALKDSQKRVRALELSAIKAKAYSDNGSASPQSSSSLEERNSFDQPLVINLAGEALDAYNEAYEEIFRMVKTEDETPPDTTYDSQKTMALRSPSLNNLPVASAERVRRKEQLSENIESDDESDDDLGKLLIQQIVEKTRQGSPLVLNAQRLLFSMDQ
uniref:Uncharacterized protein n=1 Tax=Kalanchoe fedtschenkoi TaxID=63787 RepID=A0A7N0TRF5_KALFE